MHLKSNLHHFSRDDRIIFSIFNACEIMQDDEWLQQLKQKTWNKWQQMSQIKTWG